MISSQKVLFLLSLLLLAAPSLSAKPSHGSSKILVVLDPKEVQKDQHTQFWASLEARGFSLTFRDASNTSSAASELLTKYEDKQFEGLILFAPSLKSLPPDLSPQAIYSFITTSSFTDSPGSILLGLSPTLSETYRDFAREFGIEFDERGTTLYDPFRSSLVLKDYVVDVPGNLSFTSSPAPEGLSTIISTSTKRLNLPIRYSGPVHQVTDNPLLIPLLHAPSTSFPIETKSASSTSSEIAVVEGGPLVVGEAAKLVSAFQTRLNSRVLVSGSIALFSDAYWTSETANAAFIEDATRWLWNEKGVVKILAARHFKSSDETRSMREQYRIGEEMTYEIVLSSYEKDRWTAPTSLDGLQLEVTMLDPHLRVPLIPSTALSSHSSTNTTYTATFRLPDQHGVFTILVDHRRQGMSWLEHKMQMSITPLRHDEYERFITGAWPFYATAASTVIAWLLFVGLWIGLGEEKSTKKQKSKKLE